MSTQLEQNKALVRRMYDEIWNKRQIAAISTFYAPAEVEGTTAFTNEYFAAFADWEFGVEEIMAEGDQVMLHWHALATHHGEYLGIPATGRRVTFEGMAMLRIADGKIIDDPGYFDMLTIQRQLNGEGSAALP